MSIFVVGINHKTASVAVREKISFSPEMLTTALNEMLVAVSCSEAAILSTCNRTELYYVSEAPQEESKNIFTLEEEIDLIIDFCKINNTKIDYVVAHSMSSILAFMIDSKIDSIKKIFLLEGNIIQEDFKWSSQLAEMNSIEFKGYWEKFQKQYPLILKMKLKKRIDLKNYTQNVKLLNGIGVHHYAKLITAYENNMKQFSKSFKKVNYLESENSEFLQKKEELFQVDTLKLHVVYNSSHYLMLDSPNSVIEILKII